MVPSLLFWIACACHKSLHWCHIEDTTAVCHSIRGFISRVWGFNPILVQVKGQTKIMTGVKSVNHVLSEKSNGIIDFASDKVHESLPTPMDSAVNVADEDNYVSDQAMLELGVVLWNNKCASMCNGNESECSALGT